MAGDGLQIFYGDCRGGDGRCVPATESSFGFAVSIAVDQQNNVYFSDEGNNRIRAWAADERCCPCRCSNGWDLTGRYNVIQIIGT